MIPIVPPVRIATVHEVIAQPSRPAHHMSR